MAFLIVILATYTNDELQCSFAELNQSLPRLKVLLKSDEYQSLSALHKRLEDDVRKRQRPPGNQQIGSMIAACISEKDRLLTFAAVKVKYGMLSVTDPVIARYLELDQDSIIKLRQLNTRCLDDIKQLVGKTPMEAGGEQHAATVRKARARYQDGLLQLRKILTTKQIVLFNALFASFNHDQVVLDLIVSLNGEQMRAMALAKGFAKAHPNIQLHIKAKGLILMDHKIARNYLELSPDQDLLMTSLYKDYINAIEQLQLSLSSALLKEPTEETVKFHLVTAQKLNLLYTDRFRKLLTAHQIMLTEKLLCQVIGYKYSQTSPVKELIGMTEEQSRRSLALGMKFMEEYEETRNDSAFDYEKNFRFAKYYSERIRKELLTDEQREKWDNFIDKKISDTELMLLQKDYIKRSAHYIKPIVK